MATTAWPNTVLNTIAAESLDFMATHLERKLGKTRTPARLETAVKALLKDVVTKHRRIVFDGDSYAESWHAEAEKRGLPNLKTTPDALSVLKSRPAMSLFAKYGVLNNRELKARIDVSFEKYNTILRIEARTLVDMLRTQVLPAALRFQTELAEAVASTRAAGIDCPDTETQLRSRVELIGELRRSIEAVEKAVRKHPEETERHAWHVRDKLVPAMERARAATDALENEIPDDLWPLPTYAEMLFVR